MQNNLKGMVMMVEEEVCARLMDSGMWCSGVISEVMYYLWCDLIGG